MQMENEQVVTEQDKLTFGLHGQLLIRIQMLALIIGFQVQL